MKDATYLHIKLLSKVNVYCGREFPSEMELEDRKMVNLMHVPSGKQNVGLLFHKCLIYRKVIILEFPYRIEIGSGVASWEPWEVLIMVSRCVKQKWPRSGWSHKISWTELCLYDWTGSAQGTFKVGLHLLLILVDSNCSNWTFASLHSSPINAHPKLTGLTCSLPVCMSWIAVPLLFLNNLIFLTILSFSQFFIWSTNKHFYLVGNLFADNAKGTFCFFQ